MRCPHCGNTKSTVVDSRPQEGDRARARRHKCNGCGKTWHTVEVPESVGSVRRVILCRDCSLFGKCVIEPTLRKAGCEDPFCSAGHRRRSHEQS